MGDQTQLDVIKDNPIRNGLDAFRTSFSLICEGRITSPSRDALVQLGQEGKADSVSKALY